MEPKVDVKVYYENTTGRVWAQRADGWIVDVVTQDPEPFVGVNSCDIFDVVSEYYVSDLSMQGFRVTHLVNYMTKDEMTVAEWWLTEEPDDPESEASKEYWRKDAELMKRIFATE